MGAEDPDRDDESKNRKRPRETEDNEKKAKKRDSIGKIDGGSGQDAHMHTEATGAEKPGSGPQVDGDSDGDQSKNRKGSRQTDSEANAQKNTPFGQDAYDIQTGKTSGKKNASPPN